MIRTTGFRTRKVFNSRGNGIYYAFRRGDNYTTWGDDRAIHSLFHPFHYYLRISDRIRDRNNLKR